MNESIRQTEARTDMPDMTRPAGLIRRRGAPGALLAMALLATGGCDGPPQRPLPDYASLTFDADAMGVDGQSHGWVAALTVTATDTVRVVVQRDGSALHLPSYTASDVKRIVIALHDWDRTRDATPDEKTYLHRIQYALHGNGPPVSGLALYRHSRELPEPVRELLAEALSRAALQRLGYRSTD